MIRPVGEPGRAARPARPSRGCTAVWWPVSSGRAVPARCAGPRHPRADGGRAVPQAVRPDVRRAVDGGDGLVHDGAGLPRRATAAGPSSSAAPTRQCQRWPPFGQPRRQRDLGRFAERHRALLVALPNTAAAAVTCRHHRCRGANSLTDAGRVQHLDDEPVRSASGSCCAPELAAAIASSAWS